MTTILKADIFFVISSVGVVVATIAIAVAAYYVAKAAKDTSRFVKNVEDEFDELREERRALMQRFRFATRFVRSFLRSRY